MSTLYKLCLLLLFALVVTAIPLSIALGQSDESVVSATVKLSVCGDNTVEGSEDCEGSNLNNKTCSSLGYNGGTLSCDIACSFDTSLCASPSPTPTAAPTATPSTVATTNATVNATATPEITTFGPAPTATPVEPELPITLQIFDISGVGKILTSDLPTVVGIWVTEWKNTLIQELQGKTTDIQNRKCDVNKDDRCNLTDFSILMFYIDR